MNLPDYIRALGVKVFADKFGVTERAALSWLYQTRTPRPEVAERIVRNSPVTWAGIHSREQAKRQRESRASA